MAHKVGTRLKEARREKQMAIRISDAEYDLITAAADAASSTPSAFIRRAAVIAAGARAENG